VGRTQRGSVVLSCLLSLTLASRVARAQGVDVTVKVIVQPKTAASAARHKGDLGSAGVVVWLTPIDAAAARLASIGHPGPFRLVQKGKQFTPHLLVVPTGSSVEFPNEDPFFHNVFSLFNGKRFDLGLYESGSTRSVRFDREGVSYIFCNIHPEMGAVVLSLSTPYYGVSTATGGVLIRNLPPGSYRLHVWSETAQPANPAGAEKTVQVSNTAVRLEDIVLQGTADPMEHHKNKFGEDYPPTHDMNY
jgi:plastocyanin